MVNCSQLKRVGVHFRGTVYLPEAQAHRMPPCFPSLTITNCGFASGAREGDVVFCNSKNERWCPPSPFLNHCILKAGQNNRKSQNDPDSQYNGSHWYGKDVTFLEIISTTFYWYKNGGGDSSSHYHWQHDEHEASVSKIIVVFNPSVQYANNLDDNKHRP